MAGKTKRVKIEFYRVEMPDGAPAFNKILSSIVALPNTRRRTKDLGGRHVRLRIATESSGLWQGDLTRIRMTAIPGKAGLDGSFEPFDFADDEGLGEETAFLYHSPTRVLVIQYNHYGATPALLARYVEVMGNLDGKIDFDPAINPRVLERLAEMDEYRRLEIGLAGLDDSSILGDSGRSLTGMVDVINEFRAPVAQLVVSMGHVSGSLAKQVVMRTLRWLRKSTRVTKVKVTGREDYETRIIDLVLDRLVETVEIDLDEHRRLSYSDRKVAVHEAWNTHKNELGAMFTEA